MKRAELLLPAGNMEKLKMVINYGADAVYMGGEQFNLRALSGNFSNREIEEAVKYAHEMNKKVYITLNIIPHNEELEALPEFVRFLDAIRVDGVIVADLGVLDIVKENSNLSVSVSTQASNTNWRSVKRWKEMGASRVVLAREVSIDEMKQIKDKVPDIEMEVFIHGAMCISISGRCLMSNYMTGRDANRGSCAHPCRWKYSLVEEKRPGEYFPVYEDETGTYIFNSKDLCTIEYLDKILEAGADSLKIEGRMKGIYYGAVAAKMYRTALDSYYMKNGVYVMDPSWKRELESISHRNYTTGFYVDSPTEKSQNYETATYKQTHTLIAKVLEVLGNNEYIMEIRNRVESGKEIEIISPKLENRIMVMPEMENQKNGEIINVAHPNTIVKIKSDLPLLEMDMLRRADYPWENS